MTFDEWWELLLEQMGKPRSTEQESLMRIFMEAAWIAGFKQGTKKTLERMKPRRQAKEGP